MKMAKASEADLRMAMDLCGALDATPIADQHICADCYIARGSCCTEWDEPESTAEGQTRAP